MQACACDAGQLSGSEAGARIGPYQLIRETRRGGMGELTGKKMLLYLE